MAAGLVVAAAVAFALPAGATAQQHDPPQLFDGPVYCDQPHSLDPPRFRCGPETVLNPFLEPLDPIWPGP